MVINLHSLLLDYERILRMNQERGSKSFPLGTVLCTFGKQKLVSFANLKMFISKTDHKAKDTKMV